MAQNGLIRNSFEVIRSKLCKHPGGRITLEKNDDTGIAQIVLDHPEKRNALSGQMMVELRDCVEDLEKWDAGKGVVLTGRGQVFCSGGDLDFARASTPQNGMDMCLWMQDALRRLQNLPLVSCCLVHGVALGGGSELSIFCDYVVATEGVKYGFVQGNLGITTAWGGGTRLVQRVGHKKALDILLMSKVMSAEECLAAGLVDAIVSSEKPLEETIAWLSEKLCLDHQVLRGFKSIVANSSFHGYEESMNLEREIFAPFWGGSLNKQYLTKNPRIN